MTSKLTVDTIQGKMMMHDTTFTKDLTVEENTSALLIGPIGVTSRLTVPQSSNLTVFNSISVTGTLDVTGTLAVSYTHLTLPTIYSV